MVECYKRTCFGFQGNANVPKIQGSARHCGPPPFRGSLGVTQGFCPIDWLMHQCPIHEILVDMPKNLSSIRTIDQSIVSALTHGCAQFKPMQGRKRNRLWAVVCSIAQCGSGVVVGNVESN